MAPMDEQETSPDREKKPVHHENGITFFDRKTERAFFFVMTLGMLVLGLLYKLGIL